MTKDAIRCNVFLAEVRKGGNVLDLARLMFCRKPAASWAEHDQAPGWHKELPRNNCHVLALMVEEGAADLEEPGDGIMLVYMRSTGGRHFRARFKHAAHLYWRLIAFDLSWLIQLCPPLCPLAYPLQSCSQQFAVWGEGATASLKMERKTFYMYLEMQSAPVRCPTAATGAAADPPDA